MPVIKRYPNRKLYDTDAKRYVTLNEIAGLIRAGEEVVVTDHASDEDLTAVAADEAPTRILKPEAAPPVAAMKNVDDEGVETTQRIVQPPAYEAFFRRHRGAVLGIGMVLMFLIGWLLRALLG